MTDLAVTDVFRLRACTVAVVTGDLLTAAAAEHHDATVLHYNGDFDTSPPSPANHSNGPFRAQRAVGADVAVRPFT
jgi:hypothetical protein